MEAKDASECHTTLEGASYSEKGPKLNKGELDRITTCCVHHCEWQCTVGQSSLTLQFPSIIVLNSDNNHSTLKHNKEQHIERQIARIDLNKGKEEQNNQQWEL